MKIRNVFFTILMLLAALVSHAQVPKDLAMKVASSVSAGSNNYHLAVTSSYGYSVSDIASGDEYAVRNGNDIIRYRILSKTLVGVPVGYNVTVNMTPLDGYSGSFPTAVAEIYTPSTNLSLSLIDPNVPVITQWGLINKNMLEIDGAFSDYVQYGDSLVAYVTPSQLSDSLEQAKEIYFTTTVPSGHQGYKMAIDTVGTDTIYFNKSWPSGASWVRFSVPTVSGAPFYTATSPAYASFFPTGTPPVGSLIWNPYLGAFARKTGASSYTLIGAIAGQLVPFGYEYADVDSITGWDMRVYAKGMMGATLATGSKVNAPLGLSSALVGSRVSVIVNNSTNDSIYVDFNEKFVYADDTPLGTVGVDTLEWRVYEFVVNLGSDFANRLVLLNDDRTQNGGATDLTLSGSGPVTLNSSTGSDVTFTAGANVTLTRTGNDLSIAASSGTGTDLTLSGSGPVTLNSSSGTDVTFTAGSNVTLTRSGNDLTIAATGGGGGLSGVNNLNNGLDITVNGSSQVEIAYDITELSTVAPAGADSLLIWDSSANTHGVTSVTALLGLVSFPVTGVNDQANGFDITLSGTLVQVDPDFSELPNTDPYSGLEQIMYRDLFDNQYKAMSLSALSGGYMDLTTNQSAAGIKKFTTGLQWGSGTLPTGAEFGAANQTVFALKGGTNAYLAESAWSTFGGLIVENNRVSGGGNQTTRFIVTGDDTGAGFSSVLQIWARNAGLSQDVKLSAQFGYNGMLVGNGTTVATGVGGGAINTPLGGVGFEGALSNYRLSGVGASSGFGLFENGGLNMEVPPGQQAWVPFSDIRMKHDTVSLNVTPAQIRQFNAYSFKWNASDSTTIGVLAQQIQPMYPEIVHVIGGTVDTMGVDYSALAAIGFAANKTLQSQIDNPKDSVSTEVATESTARKFAILPVDVSIDASQVVNPPSSPQKGDWFAVVDSRASAGTHNITIDFTTASQKLYGVVQDHVMSINGEYVRFTYISEDVGWIISNN